MITNQLNKPVLVQKKVVEIQRGVTTVNNYHEIIYVAEGSGIYRREEIKISFQEGDLFLISKGLSYALEIEGKVIFYSVKFTEETKTKLRTLVKSSNGIAVPPSKTKSPLNNKVVIGAEDKQIIEQLFEFLFCLGNDVSKNYNMILYQLLCIVNITERNLTYEPIDKDIPQEKKLIKHILKYIHKNIKRPEKLLLATIANEFNLTPNKLGAYFKKETDFSVKQYVNTSRMKIIGEKAAKSDLSFSEIAYEFGFVDESHLNKAFKKHFNQSPSEYRRGISEI